MRFQTAVKRMMAVARTDDAELLHRFVATRDQSAFTGLVERHGPMVLGVCQRILRHQQDAEDAFQATFLVLARKAASIKRPEQLSCWLHGVARRVALNAHQRRRSVLPLDEFTLIPAKTLPKTEVEELRLFLDEAIAQLPEHYRSVFLTCHAEGLTLRMAAKRLGTAEGTIFSRLSRARRLLQRYLSRRGISNSSLAILGILGVKVPASLAAQTTQLLIASAPLSVSLLTTGVLSTMFWSKCIVASVTVCVMSLVGWSATYLYGQSAGGKKADSVKVETQEEKIKLLSEQLVQAQNQLLEMKSLLKAREEERMRWENQFKLYEDERKKLFDERLSLEKMAKSQQSIMDEYRRKMHDMEDYLTKIKASQDSPMDQLKAGEKNRLEQARLLQEAKKAEAVKREEQARIEEEAKWKQAKKEEADQVIAQQRKVVRMKLLMNAKNNLQEQIQALRNDGSSKDDSSQAFSMIKTRLKLLAEVDEKLLREELGLTEASSR